jgi:predicted dehydrogenase
MLPDLYEIDGRRVLECSAEGPLLRTAQDAVDLIGEAKSAGANIVVLPIARLDPAFFQLRTGIAGEVVQKFVTYRVAAAIVGDTTQLEAESKSLRDFIRESNQGGSIWFLADKEELQARLGAAKRAP